jgi:hypothetical protein
VTLSSTLPAGSDKPLSARTLLVVLLLLASAAAGLRLLGLNHDLSVDEAFTLNVAAAPDFWTKVRADVHPPTFYYLVRLAQEVTASITALRLISVACGFGLFAVAVLAFRRQPVAAIVAGTLVATLPGFVAFSQQLRPYALLLLLLAAALIPAVRIFQGSADRRDRIVLSALLTAAAAIHLVTVFYLLAVAPLLLWPSRHAGTRRLLIALGPLVPAGLLVVVLKFFVVTPANTVSGGWWIPVDATAILDAWRDTLGWTEMQWMADAWSRHAPGGVWLVRIGAIVAALVAAATAWIRRPVDALATALLVVAAI